MRLALAGMLLALPAFAQDQSIQRELVLRQQQSEAFSLQLRQSQQMMQVPAADFRRRQELESSQLQQRQRLEEIGARQLRDVAVDTPESLRPQERARFESERRPLLVAPGQPPAPVVELAPGGKL